MWGRFVLFKSEDIQSLRLQSELRGLSAKMGVGSDLDSLLEERDRLRAKKADTERQVPHLNAYYYKSACFTSTRTNADRERQVAELNGKLTLLEDEVRHSGTRLEEARREVLPLLALRVIYCYKSTNTDAAQAEEHVAKLRSERRASEASEARCRELQAEVDLLEREVRASKDAVAAERRALTGLRGDLNKVKEINVSWLSEEELDDLFRRHDKDKSGDIDAQVYSKC